MEDHEPSATRGWPRSQCRRWRPWTSARDIRAPLPVATRCAANKQHASNATSHTSLTDFFTSPTLIMRSIGRKTRLRCAWNGTARISVTRPWHLPMWLATWSTLRSCTPARRATWFEEVKWVLEELAAHRGTAGWGSWAERWRGLRSQTPAANSRTASPPSFPEIKSACKKGIT